MHSVEPIDVRRYDAVIRALEQQTEADLADVAHRTGVALRTVNKIVNGRIARPPVVVLRQLDMPRRCPECGGLCRDWPCIACTMRERNRRPSASRLTRFVYDRRLK